MKKMTNKYMILIDSRESNKEIQELFNNQKDFKIEIKKLEYGDIIFGDNIAIERKTESDLINSIMKSDFFSKLYTLKSHYKIVYLWIDTTREKWFKALSYRPKYTWKSIEGTFLALDSMGILIKEFEKLYASEYFYKAFKRILEKKEFIPKSEVKKKNVPLVTLKLQNLMTIPSIGYKKGVELLKEFKTIENIINASKNENNRIMNNINQIFCK